MKCITTLLILLFSFSLLAQKDEDRYPILRVSYDLGVFFATNSYFKNNYYTSSTFSHGPSLTVGMSTWKLMPYFAFGRMVYRGDTVGTIGDSSVEDEKFDYVRSTRNRFALGLMAPLPLKNGHFITFSGALTMNTVVDDLQNFDKTLAIGFITTLGYEYRINSLFTIHTNFGYDYLNLSEVIRSGKDRSGFIYNFGLSLNFAGGKARKPASS